MKSNINHKVSSILKGKKQTNTIIKIDKESESEDNHSIIKKKF